MLIGMRLPIGMDFFGNTLQGVLQGTKSVSKMRKMPVCAHALSEDKACLSYAEYIVSTDCVADGIDDIDAIIGTIID